MYGAVKLAVCNSTSKIFPGMKDHSMETKMFDIEHFNHLNYIKKEPLTGSMKGMRYMLRKKTEGEENFMEGIVWPEPYCYAKTPEEKKTRKRFTLDAEGLAEAVDWLNEEWDRGKNLRKTGESYAGITEYTI